MSLANEYTDNFFMDESLILDAHLRLLFRAYHYETPCIHSFHLKFIYSEKATKFCEIFPLLLSLCTIHKSKGKISQNVAFSEYTNFTMLKFCIIA